MISVPQSTPCESNRPREARPIVIGSDTELGNFVLGMDSHNGTGAIASRALLREIEGFSSSASGVGGCQCENCQSRRRAEGQSIVLGAESSVASKSQDWGRKYLPTNGGCVYIDLDHLELCTPEVTSAYDFVAAWHAMLKVAASALGRVNARATKGVRLKALVNNSDGKGNSYGGHLSFLVSRSLWDNLFHRKVHTSLFLAAHQTSSIILTGQGKVGAENGQTDVPYQLSQRADFFETMQAVQTTFRRPILNTRDEPLCGRDHRSASAASADRLARLHVIFYDANLQHAACLLKVGTMQLVLAMLEQGHLDPSLILDDPLEAVLAWSHDPDLHATAHMANGKEMTALDVQWRILDLAQRRHDEGAFEDTVPRAAEILNLWDDTLRKLQEREFDALASRLDWVLKRQMISRALSRRPGLEWSSPEAKHLDLLYSSLDPAEGLFWNCQRAGILERAASDAEIDRFHDEPPDDTRAWTRARLMRLAGPEGVDDMDWDSMRFRLKGARRWPSYPTRELGDPLLWTRSHAAESLETARTLEEALAALEEIEERAPANSLAEPSTSLIVSESHTSNGDAGD